MKNSQFFQAAMEMVKTAVGFKIDHKKGIEITEKKPVIIDLPGHVRHWFSGIQMKIIKEVTEYPNHMLVQLPNGHTHLYYNPNM